MASALEVLNEQPVDVIMADNCPELPDKELHGRTIVYKPKFTNHLPRGLAATLFGEPNKLKSQNPRTQATELMRLRRLHGWTADGKSGGGLMEKKSMRQGWTFSAVKSGETVKEFHPAMGRMVGDDLERIPVFQPRKTLAGLANAELIELMLTHYGFNENEIKGSKKERVAMIWDYYQEHDLLGKKG